MHAVPSIYRYAKTSAPNSRTTQLLINFVDNPSLDALVFIFKKDLHPTCICLNCEVRSMLWLICDGDALGLISRSSMPPLPDAQGFAPVGKVVAGTEYLSRVHDPTPGNRAGVDQQQYLTKGDAWIHRKYPEINFIRKASIVPE